MSWFCKIFLIENKQVNDIFDGMAQKVHMLLKDLEEWQETSTH